MQRTNRFYFFAGLLMLVLALATISPVYAKPENPTKPTPSPYTGTIRALGNITGVNLDDDGTFSVTVEIYHGSTFILQYFPQRVASEAGRLIGQQVRITGFVVKSGDGVYWLTHATFAHDQGMK